MSLHLKKIRAETSESGSFDLICRGRVRVQVPSTTSLLVTDIYLVPIRCFVTPSRKSTCSCEAPNCLKIFTTKIFCHVKDITLAVCVVNRSYFSMRSFCDGPLEFASDDNCCFTLAIFTFHTSAKPVNIT